MLRRYNMFINNLEATLYKGESKVLHFVIRKRALVSYEVFDDDLLPAAMRKLGVTYVTVNDFFKYRVCMDGCMGIEEYLRDLGLEVYDFEQIVRRLEGKNNIDSYRLVDIT